MVYVASNDFVTVFFTVLHQKSNEEYLAILLIDISFCFTPTIDIELESRSTYYKALVRVPSNNQKAYEEFGRKVKQAYDDSKQRYGAVKICRVLNDNGTPCSIKRVQRHITVFE